MSLPVKLGGGTTPGDPSTTPKSYMNALPVEVPLQFQTLFYLSVILSCLDCSLAGKPVETAMRFHKAHSSGVGEGSSRALVGLKAESTGPNKLFAGHLFTSLLLL